MDDDLYDIFFGNGSRKAINPDQRFGGGYDPVSNTMSLTAGDPMPVRPDASQEPDFTIAGQKPKKLGWFRRLQDNILVSQGKTPINQLRFNQKRLNEALGGFQDDPQGTIDKVMKIDPELGFKMYDKFADNERSRRSAEALTLLRQGQIMDRISRLTDPRVANEKTWPTVYPILQRLAETNGVDLAPYGLSETYDPTKIEALRSGGTNVYQQERLEDFDNSEAGRNARAANVEAGRNARFEDAEAGRDERFAKAEVGRGRRSKNGDSTTYQTPHGSITMSADKSKAYHIDEKGIEVRMRKIAGRWVPLERIIPAAPKDIKQKAVDGKWVTIEEEDNEE